MEMLVLGGSESGITVVVISHGLDSFFPSAFECWVSGMFDIHRIDLDGMVGKFSTYILLILI